MEELEECGKSDDQDRVEESVEIETPFEFLNPHCHRPGCEIESPYNLISLNGILTCLEHEYLLDPIVYSNKKFKQNRIGQPICHGNPNLNLGLKCRRSAKLRPVYGGLYCKEHLLEGKR
jgi:hypothetical protein